MDYYKVLEVDKNASDDEIKKSYRKLAIKYHPDRNQGNKEAEQKFKDIAEAYSVLSDPKKKQQYDMFGSVDNHGFNNVNPNDIFSSIFGGNRNGFNPFEDIFGFGRRNNVNPSQRPIDGKNEFQRIEITLEESYYGCVKEIELEEKEKCSECNGFGGEKEKCIYCNGTGMITKQNGFMSFSQTCHHCNGNGFSIKNNCHHCNGNGYIGKSFMKKINIPKGVRNETKLRLSGYGGIGLNGGDNGDVYIVININDEDSCIRRDNDNLITYLDVKYSDIINGNNVNLHLWNDDIEIKIPKKYNILSKPIIIHNKGFNNGDLYVFLNIKIPDIIYDEQLNELKELENKILNNK